MDQTFQLLNTIYQPIYTYIKNLLKVLKESGYDYKWNFYNNHSVMKENEWTTEYYPIPVITINGLCDLGTDIDHIFIECKMNKDQAIKFNWNLLSNYQFEVYGVKDYLNNFYNPSLTLESISPSILQSTESDIAISFQFGYLEDLKVLIDFIGVLYNLIVSQETQ